MFCHSCGEKNRDEASFCAYCGTAVSDANSLPGTRAAVVPDGQTAWVPGGGPVRPGAGQDSGIAARVAVGVLIGLIVLGFVIVAIVRDDQSRSSVSVNNSASSGADSSSRPAQPKSSSSSGALTRESAQRAVDKAFESMKRIGANELIIAPQNSATVQGVQELPQENAARASVTYSGVVIRHGVISGPARQGVAVFTHYNDGRWVLTQLLTDDIVNFSGINTNIEVQ